jgi:hypothetical protein
MFVRQCKAKGFRIPAENRTSVSKLRETHWQQRLISQHERLDLIPLFKLPRTLLVIILCQWITIETLCLFDTAVTSRNSLTTQKKEKFNFSYNEIKRTTLAIT